jgi:beta-glucosidase
MIVPTPNQRITPTSPLAAKQKEAKQIVDKLSLKEKIELCSGLDMWYLKPISTGVPSVMITDGPHGLRKQLEGESTDLLKGRVKATCFPTASCLACSWDEDLLCEVGKALAHECIQEDVAVLLGPGMNIKRHACGGRNFEYLSEDPLLSGRLATSIVRGIQSQNVGCCIKHFCVNNQETSRMRVNAIVDERTLREIYFRGFEYVLREEMPAAIMCAYNRLNSVYCSEHDEIWDMVRNDWGFDGCVMTDWGATNDRVEGIRATVDLEMPGSKGSFDAMIAQAVKEGALPLETLDESVQRNVALSLLGVDVMERSIQVDLENHHDLARNVAMESAVLLRNIDNLLPLANNTKVAVIGDFAKNPRYQGMGSSQVNPTKIDCAWDRIQEYTNEPIYAQGYNRVDTGETARNSDLIAEAVDAAKETDVALIFCGLPEIMESEGFDRVHMDMPANHNALVAAVCKANPRTVVILSNGAPVSMPWIDQTGAILEGYLSGQAGGSALVDLIFGVASPCGKLAESFPITQDTLASNAYFPGEHDQVQYREGLNVGYRHFDSAHIPVLFPFGHGETYTTFDYGDLQVDLIDVSTVRVKVTITNSGSVTASEIVQCYIHDLESSVYRPEQELKAFAKKLLKPGQSSTVEFTLDKDAFSFYDVGHQSWIIEAGDFEIRLGASSRDIRVRETINLASVEVSSARARDSHPPFHYHVRGRGVSDEVFRCMLGGEELPTPVVDVWPFHHNTLMYELQHSYMGSFFRRKVLDTAFAGMDDSGDPHQRRLMEALVDHTPLRNLVVFSQGNLLFEDLQVIIHALNMCFINAIFGIWPCIKRRVWRDAHHDKEE